LSEGRHVRFNTLNILFRPGCGTLGCLSGILGCLSGTLGCLSGTLGCLSGVLRRLEGTEQINTIQD
jgi:hypothetical protein